MGKEKTITVKVFLGLVTSKGKVRLVLSREKDTMLSENISSECVYGLPGGLSKEKDLSKLLTSDALFAEGHRKVFEKLGISVKGLPMGEPIYRTVYQSPDGKKEDWTFMIAIPPENWDENAETLKGVKILDVTARQLEVLGRLNFIVSGKNEMYRLAMAAIYLGGKDRFYSSGLLTQVNIDWEEKELFYDTTGAFDDFREELGVGDSLVSLSRGEKL